MGGVLVPPANALRQRFASEASTTTSLDTTTSCTTNTEPSSHRKEIFTEIIETVTLCPNRDRRLHLGIPPKMSAEKRPADDDPGSKQSLVKRQNVRASEGALARINASSNALVQSVRVTSFTAMLELALIGQQAPRTSALQAPVMELSGHSGEIFTAKFDPTGNLIASGSMDRSISASAPTTG